MWLYFLTAYIIVSVEHNRVDGQIKYNASTHATTHNLSCFLSTMFCVWVEAFTKKNTYQYTIITMTHQ